MNDRQVHLELIELTNPGRTFKWAAQAMPYPVHNIKNGEALCLMIKMGWIDPITLQPRKR